MNKKSKILSLVFCGIAFVVMLVYMCFVDDPAAILDALLKAKPQFLLLAVAFILIYWFLEAVGLHIISKAITPGVKFKDILTVAVIGQYFNCITPFASGGQPIQAYYMVKYGANLGSSLTALLSKFISYQFVLTIYSLVLLVLRLPVVTDQPLMITLVIVGYAVNAVVIVCLFMLAFFKKPTVKIAHFIVRLLGKIHIVRDVPAKLKYIDDEMDMYCENFRFIKSKPWLVVKVCLVTVLQLTVYFGISFVIYLGFGCSGSDLLTILACQAFVLLISSFVPLPGALGAAESSYVLFFQPIFGPFVNLSTFIWRFLTFYFAIIVGMIVTFAANRGIGKREQLAAQKKAEETAE